MYALGPIAVFKEIIYPTKTANNLALVHLHLAAVVILAKAIALLRSGTINVRFERSIVNRYPTTFFLVYS